MVSDEVMIYAINQQMILEITNIVLRFVIFLIVLAAISILFKKSRTQNAREQMADLYICGAIRKFAKEDDINLDQELKELRRMEKLEKASMRLIDRMIEVELNEKISAKSQKKIQEINQEEAIEYKDLTKK